jgi:pimeloyl-ACP methyl ester carboxylesterase
VLVHGYTSNLSTQWVASGWVRRLARSHRVLAMDVRGHGRSSKPLLVAAYDRRQLARDVVGVLNAAGEERAAIFGYSMGAMIAAQALVDYPPRFTRAVLGGMGAAWPDGSDCAGRGPAETPVRDLQRSAAGLAWWLRYYNPLAMRLLRQGAFHGQQPLPLERLDEIAVPVLIAVGARDQFCPGTALAAERIPNARRVVFEGQTHHSTVSDPRFHAAVLEFLAEA